MRTYWVDHWHVEAAQQYLPWGMEAAKMVASTTQAPSDLLRAADLVLAYSQVLLDLGQLDQAQKLLQASLTCFHDQGSRKGEAATRYELAQNARLRGNSELAKQYLEDSLVIMRELNERHGEAVVLAALGQLALLEGKFQVGKDYFQEAWSLYQQSLALAREMRDQRGQAASLLGLSIIHLAANQLEQAELLTQEILSLLHHVSDHGIEVVTWLINAQIAVARGRFDEAEQRYRTCLDLVRQGPGALYPVVAIECAQFLITERHKQHEGCALLDETIQRYITMGLDNEARDARAFAQQLGCGDAQ